MRPIKAKRSEAYGEDKISNGEDRNGDKKSGDEKVQDGDG